MITWVTVWVLTVIYDADPTYNAKRDSYQLTYATQHVCLKQGEFIKKSRGGYSYRCDFQQIPVVTGDKK